MTPLAVTLLVAFSNVALHLNVRQQALCGQAAGALVHGACRKHRSGRQQARTGAQRLPEAHSLVGCTEMGTARHAATRPLYMQARTAMPPHAWI